MTTNSPNSGQLFTLPYTQPLSVDGKVMPACYRLFYYLNSTTLAPVYQDPSFMTPYTQPIVAGSNGLFAPIYLNPAIEYRSQLFNAAGQLLEDCDHVNNNTGGTPYVAGFAKSAVKLTTTSRSNQAVGIIDPDLQISLPSAGTYKIDLDLVMTAGTSGTTPGIELLLGSFTFSATTPSGPMSLQAMGTINGAEATLPLPVAPTVLFLPLGTTALSNTVRFSGTVQLLAPTNNLAPYTFALYWCQANSSASPTSILAGSSLTMLQVE